MRTACLILPAVAAIMVAASSSAFSGSEGDDSSVSSASSSSSSSSSSSDFSASLDWPQFRGPGARGIGDGPRPPVTFGPDENCIWATPLPPGISSPCISRGRIFVTGFREPMELVTFCLDQQTGEILWERRAPNERLESTHAIGSPATATPATDGERVYVFFGSYGLLCYDYQGNTVWERPLGPFVSDFGTSASPIVVGDRLVQNCDDDINSFLLCVDKYTGDTVWEADRSEFPRGYSTPVVWEVQGRQQIVVAGTLRVIGYDLETGEEIWTVRGFSRIVNTTPVVGNGLLYLATWAPGGDTEDRIPVPNADAFFAEYDADGDGRFTLEELPQQGPLNQFAQRFTQIDGDKDGYITRDEWDFMMGVFADARNRLVAIRPGGSGDITDTHVVWSYDRQLPYVPSPLYYEGILYMVKSGGIATALDAESGEVTAMDRLDSTADFYASPVAAAGLIYMVSQRGEVTVLEAGPDWTILATNELGEESMATPAILDGRIYIRTVGHLYCFGESP